MKISAQIKKDILEEVQKLMKVSDKVQEKAINNIPIEHTQNLDDEKELIQGMGGPSKYIAHNKAMYKMLGGISGVSLGAKLGLMTEPHETFNLENIPDQIDTGDLIGYGITGLGALAGGYLGNRLGNQYGEHLSKKTLKELGYLK